MSKPKYNELQLKILKKYSMLAERKGYHPSSTQMSSMCGITNNMVKHHFGGYPKLREVVKEYAPKVFAEIVDESIFTKKHLDRLVEKTEKHSRFFLSTAVMGCNVHEGFFKAIANYNKRNKGMLLVLPTMDPAADVPFHLDSLLANTSVLVDDLSLNDNIFLSSLRLSAKHIDPLTGLGRIGQRNGSFIFASPKQRLKMIPTSNEKTPHAIMTTGALTKPNYKTKRYLSGRTAYIADHDHVIGGLIVEIEDETIFHFRQVQADRYGNFIDLGVEYRADGSTNQIQPEALILGDWHSGETDLVARQAFIEAKDSVANTFKPKRIVVHDGFNGMSISHHEVKNKVLRAQRALENKLNLKHELEKYAEDLEDLCALPYVKEVVIVKSNHDEFLDRYLADARYVEDPQNHLIALELAHAMIELKKNPIQAYMEQRGIKNGLKLRWLKRDEDYKLAGVEIGAHGDQGANGARGSLMHMESAYGDSVSGHTHTPEILRGAMSVGTTSILDPEYRKGPSSWLHTSGILYPNGSRQLINSIDGEWRLK